MVHTVMFTPGMPGYRERQDGLCQGRNQVQQQFGVSEERRDGVSIVTPHGEVDVATAPALREHLDAVIERDTDAVVADLSGVTFIDSTGLGVLIGAQRRCDEAGRDLRVVVSEPKIHKVFEITGLTEHFTICESLELAMRV